MSNRKHHFWMKRLWSAVRWLCYLGLAGFALSEALTWPEVKGLAKQNPRTTAFIEQEKERARRAGEKPEVFWQWVPYSQISPQLKEAVLVAEDISFFSHRGFDLAEIWSALKESLQEKEFPRGASTLSQQVAKNLWLSPSRNPYRKLKEAILTVQLERSLTKRRIFEIYLNVVEFGPGIYGAEAAARYYFGHSASDLSAEEAAHLAAGLPKPRAWHPGSKSAAYQRRVAIIRERMNEINLSAKL